MVTPDGILECNSRDNVIRWKEGERLDHLFEERCDKLQASGKLRHPAIVTENVTLSYSDLDGHANQLARYLLRQGIRQGDRVGVLFDKSFHAYVALLAILKIGASYVPIDAGFPRARIEFIVKDARVKAFVTLFMFQDRLEGVRAGILCLDRAESMIAAESAARLREAEKEAPESQLCYIIYTSGSTGNPKGVAIEHPSICNFVRVAGEAYDIHEDDRVYQGMTIAFDFSVEEIWVPLIAGATLVPGPPGMTLLGGDLCTFLAKNEVTVLCCVPTLLATMDEALPSLRLLIVSGEPCPHDLVLRWHRPDRRILNAYGPTETTVTATVTDLAAHKPVTIGRPLPTYFVVILDETGKRTVPRGTVGEIGIAGIGLARGYVNRDELTRQCFIPDFLGIVGNPSGRIYRTGDLGLITGDDEVEYLGRVDAQVKVRGYRIELAEIESALLQVPEIAQAVAATYAPEPGVVELVAYYALKAEASGLPRTELFEKLRGRLPAYMVPAFLEEVPALPMLPSHKVDRKKLPPPARPRLVVRGGAFAAPRTAMERTIASALAGILHVDSVSTGDDFFRDLGAHSLLLARFCAEIRKHLPGADVSMRDIYLHPSVAKLAAHLSSGAESESQGTAEPYRVAGNLEYYLCGTLQCASYLADLVLAFWVLIVGFDWISSSTGFLEAYMRTVAYMVLSFLVLTGLPILLKWILIGKWKAGKIPIWSLGYFRFWFIKHLIRMSPILLFVGTPLYCMYLRLLGARIGRRVVIYSKHVPACTDLIAIGDDTILLKDSAILGYKAQGGYIHTERISIGKNAMVGEASVLDIDTVMEDDTQLGRVSSLQSGQRIPCGKRYHGSPAEETRTDYRSVSPAHCTPSRRVLFSVFQLLSFFLISTPSFYLAAYVLCPATLTPPSLSLALTLLPVSLAIFFGLLLSGLGMNIAASRLLERFVEPGKVYVLYGFHYCLYRFIFTLSNSYLFNLIFGDSSFITSYLKLIGYNLSDLVQTGSNFGTSQKHDIPFLCEVGKGTMVSDGLSMINAELSSTSFRLCKVAIGADNFLGNGIVYPSGGKTGKNCLLATKTMIPIDGAVREGIGLLGSPCFEIPRSSGRDRALAAQDESIRRQRLRRKNIVNAGTLGSFLLVQWLYFYMMLLLAYVVWTSYPSWGVLSLTAGAIVLVWFTILYFVIVERMGFGLRKMKPRTCSIYDPYYWKIEHYWKLADSILQFLFAGTPLRTLITRMAGARVGKKVFDDGCMITEKMMVHIGDYSNLNPGTVLQAHSLEEGVFKSDYIEIGRGCTVGPYAYVHYGIRMGDNAVLDPDSFLMKGEILDPGSSWRGNPARVRCSRPITLDPGVESNANP